MYCFSLVPVCQKLPNSLSLILDFILSDESNPFLFQYHHLLNLCLA